MSRTLKTPQASGDISIYITLVLSLTMLTAAVFMALILARQMQLSRDVEFSERALYAANSGLEEALYHLAQKGETTYSIDPAAPQSIDYGGESAYYSTAGQDATLDPASGGPCIPQIKGTFRHEDRRLSMMSSGCVAP